MLGTRLGEHPRWPASASQASDPPVGEVGVDEHSIANDEFAASVLVNPRAYVGLPRGDLAHGAGA